MNFLFFDTETTGIPKDYKAPLTDSDNWPRLVEISMNLTDDKGKTIVMNGNRLQFSEIIYPSGFEIPKQAAEIHGINQELARKKGRDLHAMMVYFSAMVQVADIVVGHNVSFDRKIVGAELYRCALPDVLHFKPRFCTMQSSTQFCQIPQVGRGGYKWPKLEELHLKLFGGPPDKDPLAETSDFHRASFDVEVTRKCFFEMLRRGIITQSDINKAFQY